MKNEFIDPVCVPDVFATELVSVEDLGGVFRFTFTSCQNGEKLVVARVALLTSAVHSARVLTAAAVHSAVPIHRMETPAHH